MLDHANLILVATDLAAGGDDALREGHLRAEATGARLIVLHVLGDSHATLAVVREAVVERVRQLTSRGEDAVEVVLVEGDAADAICDEAARRHVALLVIGPGRTHLAWGGVAAKVIRHAPCEVLVARPPVDSDVVLAGTDLSEASVAALARAGEEAERTGGSLVAVHVIAIEPVLEADVMGMGMVALPAPAVSEDLRQTAEQRLAHIMKENGLDARVCACSGQPGMELVRMAERLSARLIVVGTHGRTGWSRFFVGSVAEEVARSAPCSVLVHRHTPADERYN